LFVLLNACDCKDNDSVFQQTHDYPEETCPFEAFMRAGLGFILNVCGNMKDNSALRQTFRVCNGTCPYGTSTALYRIPTTPSIIMNLAI